MAVLSHIAVQCYKMKETLDCLSSQWSPLGIDSWKTIDYKPEGEELLSGETFKIQSSLSMLTPEIEVNVLDSVISGPWFEQQYIRRRGDCIEHIAWAVDDFDGMIEKFEKIGFHNVSCADFEGNRWVQLRNIWTPGGWNIELLENGMHGPIINMLKENNPNAVEGADKNHCYFSQIGTLVFDLDRAMKGLAEAFDLLGIGPFTYDEFAPTNEEMIIGNPFVMKSARAQAAPNIDYVFNQPISGDNKLFDHLQEKYEGVSYLGFTVKDFDAMVSAITNNGYEVFASGAKNKKRWCYFDTGNKYGGVILKILEEGAENV